MKKLLVLISVSAFFGFGGLAMAHSDAMQPVEVDETSHVQFDVDSDESGTEYEVITYDAEEESGDVDSTGYQDEEEDSSIDFVEVSDDSAEGGYEE